MNTLGTRRTVKTVTLRAESLTVGDVVLLSRDREAEIRTLKKNKDDDGVQRIYVSFLGLQGIQTWKSFESVKVQVLV